MVLLYSTRKLTGWFSEYSASCDRANSRLSRAAKIAPKNATQRVAKRTNPSEPGMDGMPIPIRLKDSMVGSKAIPKSEKTAKIVIILVTSLED